MNLPHPPVRIRSIYQEDVEEMKKLRAIGWSLTQMAKRFGCSPTTISQAINGKYGATIPKRPTKPSV